ncbi:uncharacterized protein L3040_000481 [Drepanopeziza brunnea f. sp. 'multigermtubi']|uniref:uncharacterized protein n=1 Tax=Drepanopeziza brunnea f. sp. 'multigermtubi' TaxID=698441 RepID=UPI0023901DC2|nr:hypothetical protein L3040_000481 [Drepanopeziza brunnea f. sp. 'multigermtubi']
MPFIEASRKQQQGENGTRAVTSDHSKRDLSPKSISDSLSRVPRGMTATRLVMAVTAAVDRITLQHPLSEICDLELSGMATFAKGRSSMEVSIQVAKVPKQGETVKDGDVLFDVRVYDGMYRSTRFRSSLGTITFVRCYYTSFTN